MEARWGLDAIRLPPIKEAFLSVRKDVAAVNAGPPPISLPLSGRHAAFLWTAQSPTQGRCLLHAELAADILASERTHRQHAEKLSTEIAEIRKQVLLRQCTSVRRDATIVM